MKTTPKPPVEANKPSTFATLKKLLLLLNQERGPLLLAFLAILLTSGLNLAAPWLFGRAIDTSIIAKDYSGVLWYCAVLFGLYVISFGANYAQMRLMGGVGQNVLFRLREQIFSKLQSLPIAFFNENKAGDLISRVNNDTDKLNQFFSDTLVRFMGNIFLIGGTAIFMLYLNIRLGLIALLPALGLFIITRVLSSWVKQRNAKNLQSTGSLSAEIQESLANFKVIVAFNRRDYFRDRFQQTNEDNFKAAVRAGVANTTFAPIYDLASNLAQLSVLVYGVYLITQGHLTIGLFVSFFIYLDRFYSPLRQLAMLWSTFQLALAGWDRVAAILEHPATLPVIKSTEVSATPATLEFRDVSFHYPNGKTVLKDISLRLEAGKTYALVGPTGGGKTTTASLMARLYDPSTGTVLLDGQDIRSYNETQRTQDIGFILQEPFLFTGSLLDNLFYGHPEFAKKSAEEKAEIIKQQQFDQLLKRFDRGLDTLVDPTKEGISLGQRQLIAFMRAVLRKPKLLILDEATANIDTVTEQLLEETLKKLPAETTKVIIAHRLNTIENADQIFFVNDGEIASAGSLQQAMDLLMQQKRNS